jgi:lysophospholipase L1-like esterase
LNKNWIRSITIVSSLLCLLWLVGLGWTLNEYYAAKPKKPKPVHKITKGADKKGLTIVALGDSLTKGTGDETGKGYVGAVKNEVMKRTKKPVSLLNLGINGQTSSQLKKQVQKVEVRRQIAGADLVMVTIGGNDLFRGGQGLLDYKTSSIAKIEGNYLANLKFIFGQIRKVNPHVNVFFVGLYNPFINLSTGKETSKVVRQWNYDSAEVSAQFPRVVFVPTFDLFELKVNDYLYSDKFHPNSKGYRLIAERVAGLLTW